MMEGYPTKKELKQIRNWPHTDFPGLMRFIEGIWHWPDWGWSQDGEHFYLSTGGWSGNEDIIEAMQANTVFWTICWVSSRRGGHYVFRVYGQVRQL